MSKAEAKNVVEESTGSANQDSDESTLDAEALKAQIEELTSYKTRLETEKRDLIKQRDELKSKTREKEKAFAEASGNIEEIKKAYDEEKSHVLQSLAQIKAEKEAIEKRFQSVVVKDRIRSIAKDVVADSAFDDFWTIHGSEFELDEKENIKTKSGIKTPKERLQQIVTEKSFYKAVTAQSGSGMAKPNNGATALSLSPDEFLKMSREEQRSFASKNPEDFSKLMTLK